ncbi:ras-related protein RabJ-like [Venturia canescens]|uniref:ras-related protein RabJ-like n=1 Tax=Venturia canescens TaxID=32260 RepID=UPI001C9CC448|nr:ras-related protein RabJ-like [Venturia canescens]
MKTIEGKVVVLGSQCVGKTSLINRYVSKTFDAHVGPTIGASFFTCKINLEDGRIKLQIWDTAGQERFRSMAPMYYRNANAALLVFDITKYKTFAEIKSWVTELNRNIDEALILILVGNKSDLESVREVEAEEARKYATLIGASYHETSAYQDEGIEQVFLSAALGLKRLSAGNPEVSSSLRIYDSTTSSCLTESDILHHTPMSEENFRDTSIAHGIHEKPPACC